MPRRDALQAHLKAQRIGHAVYYPLALHLQPCFAHLGYSRGSLPVTEAAMDSVISLPIFPELTPEQQDAVIEAVLSFYRLSAIRDSRPTSSQELIAKAERREALFGIVGLGYVGLPLAVELANAGYRVLGFDVSERVVDGLNAGHSHVKDVSDAQLREAVARRSLQRHDRHGAAWASRTRSRSACRRRCPSSRTRTSATSSPRPTR